VTGLAGSESDETVSAELGERVRSIVAAAESMATAVREDADRYAQARRREADEQAERRIREASEQAEALLAERLSRMTDLADRILERADVVLGRLDDARDVRRQLETLAAALGDTAQRLANELGEGTQEHPMADEVRPLRPPGEDSPPPPPPLLRPVPSDPPPAAAPASRNETLLDDARLVALQMAVAGRTREEVATHLRNAFDVKDPDPILDHVFAEGCPPSPPAVG
jgi:hypothetical protein